jgi:uncharacterized SAM-binding protein YcdF (DUF218 family)
MDVWLVPSGFHALVLALVLTALGWRRRWRARWLLLCVSAWCWLGSTPIVENALVKHLEDQYARPRDVAADPATTIVLLTTGQSITRDDGPRVRLEDGWERVACAADLWRRTGGTLLVTGGPMVGSEPVAETMARAAAALGVPAAHIVVEPRARNTRENVRFARALTPPGGPVWLATSAVHMPRAMGVARALDWPVRAWPCDYRGFDHMHWWAWLPNPGVDMTAVAHELVGGLWYRATDSRERPR